MEENEALKEAVEKVYQISEEERMQRIAELRDKAIRDEKSAYSTGFNRGKEKGEIEGRKEGIKREIAKEMLKEEIDISVISKITKLPVEEIKKLKEQNKKKE